MTEPTAPAIAPTPAEVARHELLRQAEECQFVALACAADCLDDPERQVCADRCRDTADVCELALRVIGRERTDSAVTMSVLRLVIDVARTCLTECRTHATDHQACRDCAEVCERTATSAAFLVESLNPQAAS